MEKKFNQPELLYINIDENASRRRDVAKARAVRPNGVNIETRVSRVHV